MNTPANTPRRPRLSVVVAAWTDAASLARCIGSLRAQLREEDELIVARNFALPEDPSTGLGAAGRDLELPGTATVPQLRAAGLAGSTGRIVAFLEDHCTCSPGWRDALSATHTESVQAVGGPVDLAPGGSALDAAVYFHDYAAYATPQTRGPAGALSGANMSFSRSLLERMLPVPGTPVHEAALMDWLRAHRSPMYLAAGAVVVQGKKHRAARTMRLTFSLARGYAAGRFAASERVRRAAFAAGALVLPVVLGGRIARSALRAPRLLPRLAGSAPWLALLLGCWSAGEMAGYLAGAGRSEQEWR